MAKRTLTSIEIPQADSLENVRRVVETIASGSSSRKEISEKTDISLRHIDYAIHAAKSLGFLGEGESLSTSDKGRALVASVRGSFDEREQLRAAIQANEVLQMLAPDLLDDAAPTKATLATRIQEACVDLSEATAARRAQTLLAWRTQALASDAAPAPAAPAAPAAVAPAAVAPAAAAPAAPTAPAAAAPAKKAAKPAAKKAAKKAAKPAAKKAAKKAVKPAAKKAAKKAAKPAKKVAKKAEKGAAKKAAPAAASAPSVAVAPAAEASAPKETTYEMDEA